MVEFSLSGLIALLGFLAVPNETTAEIWQTFTHMFGVPNKTANTEGPFGTSKQPEMG